MKKIFAKNDTRTRRRNKIRSRISGTAERPRLSVFKSNKYIYVQLIDDEQGKTLVAATSKEATGKGMKEKAMETGKTLATKALASKIKKVVFDRGGYRYTGIVATLADSARSAGLVF